MAESRRCELNARLDIEQILLEAQHRWLRPAEICEILQNYKNFHIAPEPPNRPPSGSLFLFDRKVLRYFRKDGHNWRKKKDGKTVKEAHERLKAGSVDVLHCYYAHGEVNENFQRRSYWMLEEELSHIVLVHYREVKGNRTNFNRNRDANVIPDNRQNEEDTSNSEVDSSTASRFQPYDYQRASPVTDTTSINSTQTSEHEDTESDNYQGQISAIPGMSFGLVMQGEKQKIPMDSGLTYDLHQGLEFPSWENFVESSNAGHQSVSFQQLIPSTHAMNVMPGQENEPLDQVFTEEEELQRVPGRFDSVEEYIKVFEPLLFEECRAQLYSSWEESSETVSGHVTYL